MWFREVMRRSPRLEWALHNIFTSTKNRWTQQILLCSTEHARLKNINQQWAERNWLDTENNPNKQKRIVFRKSYFQYNEVDILATHTHTHTQKKMKTAIALVLAFRKYLLLHLRFKLKVNWQNSTLTSSRAYLYFWCTIYIKHEVSF